MKHLFKTIVVLSVLMCRSSAQKNDNGLQRVVIIRHAEKPDNGDNLSCKGLNRALALPAVLYKKFNVPDKVYIPAVNNKKSSAQLRMLETITPFAVKYNLNIDARFDVYDTKNLAAAILKTKGYALVVWEHDGINNIARALGVNETKLKWYGDDFDSIWIIDFKNGNAILTMDKENLNPANDCN